MNTIIEQLKNVLSPEILDTVTQAVDEPKENVINALNALFPVLISGIIKKEEEYPNSGIIEHLINLLKEQALWDGGSITTDYVGIRNILMGEGEQAHQSSRFIALIFGDKIEELTSNIANHATIKIGSAYSLAIFAGTLVVAILTKNAFDNNFLPTALLKILESQKRHIFAAVPLNFIGMLGVEKYETFTTTTKEITTDLNKKSILRIIILVISLLTITLLLLRGGAPEHNKQITTPAHTNQQNKHTWTHLGKMKSVKLPNANNVTIPEHGVENQLLSFIENPQKPAEQSPWFRFDRLVFHTNSATLSPKSNAQLECIAQIMQSFPSVHILVGGFTDNTGTEHTNKSLSEKRAQNVKNHLIAMGVSADRIATKGYSTSHAIGNNSTEKGRAKNRRAGIQVIKK